ncbi:MAG: class I SAM-dependent methyltransferase [Actinomycetota bacterium]
MTDDRTEDASYVIRSGSAALDRLDLIARLFRPASIEWLERNDALVVDRFLDVGCGIGDVTGLAALAGTGATLGIDVNAEVVAAADERARRLATGATFRVAGIAELGHGELSGFDVVYARCVVSHLPDPQAALAAMLSAVRPGGLVVVEDVEVAATWCSPPEPAVARYIECYLAAAGAIGASPHIGPDLAPILRDLGAEAVQVDIVQPVLRTPEDLRITPCTMEAIAGPVIANGVADADEVERIVTRLNAWAEEPGVVCTLPRTVQVAGRRPTH